MSGHKPWRDIREVRDPNDPDVKAFRDAIDAAVAIGELRQKRGVTQADLARIMGVHQPNVSRLERSEDLFLSSLREYVEALGGELEVSARFPGEEPIPLEVNRRPVPA